MATGTRAMVSNRFFRLICFALTLAFLEVNHVSALAADSARAPWKTLQAGRLAYLRGDGGGDKIATVCRSIEGAMDPETSSGCKGHAIGSLVTIDSVTDARRPIVNSPVVAISGHGFAGYVEAIMLMPAIPLHTRFRVERLTVSLHRHLVDMDPFVDDLTLKRGALIEILAQAPYEDGVWVKLLVVDGKNRGFVGWTSPSDLDIFFY